MERAFEQQEGYRTSPNRRGTGVASIWCVEEEEGETEMYRSQHKWGEGRGGEHMDRIGRGNEERGRNWNNIVGTPKQRKEGTRKNEICISIQHNSSSDLSWFVY